MSRLKIKRRRALATNAFRINPTFKTRTQEAKHRRIAQGLPTQQALDYFLSRFEPAEKDFVLELLRPYLSFALPPASVEAPVSAPSAGPEEGASA